MKKTENSKSKSLEKRTPSFTSSGKKGLVAEGSLIPVMNYQEIKAHIADGKLVVSYGDNRIQEERAEIRYRFYMGYPSSRKKAN
jgi:hypothetical protein